MSASERPYAGIVSRTAALAIDAGALTIGFAIASSVLGLILSLFTAVEVSSPAVSAPPRVDLVVANYFVLFWTLAGETPGMRLMALRVVNAAGDPPGFGRRWSALPAWSSRRYRSAPGLCPSSSRRAGMRLMALREERRCSPPPPRRRAQCAWSGMVLAADPVFAGVLDPLRRRRRRLHDMLAGTVVVYAPTSRVRTPPHGCPRSSSRPSRPRSSRYSRARAAIASCSRSMYWSSLRLISTCTHARARQVGRRLRRRCSPRRSSRDPRTGRRRRA